MTMLLTLSNCAELEKATLKGLSIVIFGAPWSSPCRIQNETVEDFAKGCRRVIAIVLVDVEKFPEIAVQYNIQTIPTLILFQGGREMTRLVGVQSLETLSGFVKSSVIEQIQN